MGELLDRIAAAAAKAASGPLADSRERPSALAATATAALPVDANADELVERFSAELVALTGRVYGPFDADGVAAAVAEILAAQGSPEVLTWIDEYLSCPGLGDALRRVSVRLVEGAVPDDGDRGTTLQHLASLATGLTGAVAGLADTGSVVVASGRGRARAASLLPSVHVAVLPVSRIYPTMAAWLSRGGSDLVRHSANVVVITGPSRTADIELTITLGVHGPKEVHVVLFAEETASGGD